MPDPAPPLAIGAIAMVVCCAGHAVLLTVGIGGIGTVAAAVSGNNAVLTTVVALVGVVGVLAAFRFRRRARCVAHLVFGLAVAASVETGWAVMRRLR